MSCQKDADFPIKMFMGIGEFNNGKEEVMELNHRVIIIVLTSRVSENTVSAPEDNPYNGKN